VIRLKCKNYQSSFEAFHWYAVCRLRLLTSYFGFSLATTYGCLPQRKAFTIRGHHAIMFFVNLPPHGE